MLGVVVHKDKKQRLLLVDAPYPAEWLEQADVCYWKEKGWTEKKRPWKQSKTG